MRITGFGSGHIKPQVDFESQLQAAIRPSRLDSLLTVIASEVRVAGTKADERVRDYVVKELTAKGIATKVYPYDVYLPHATAVSLKLLPQKGAAKSFTLKERMNQFDEKTSQSSYPWVNGYSASAKATGELVFVNYGLHEDYRILDSLGISLKGKIAIARYGRSYRGIKALLAEDHGAAGLIIYSDPINDGFTVGDIFPDGPWRGMDAVQRGSIFNGHGDPATPGFSSLASAAKLDRTQWQRMPKIPVMPVSPEIASQLLSEIKGKELPNQSWQGGLPFRYHIGAGPARAEIAVTTDDKTRTIWNTVSTIEGSAYPNEWIVMGGHRDAWTRGANDNGSGAVSVIAAAEAAQALVKQGLRPKRTLVFATWDAEEWGLIGSTEWVEQLEKELDGKCVAYLNLDMCTTGKDFGASADPVLATMLREATKAVKDPSAHDTSKTSIYNAWVQRVKPVEPLKIRGGKAEPELGLLGGGSDFSPFYNHLGVPSTEFGFSGPYGQYHSDHDNLGWTRHFGDSTFKVHAACAKLLIVEASRLANADVIPYDFEELAIQLQRFSEYVKGSAREKLADSTSLMALDSAIARLKDAAFHVNVLREDKGFGDGSTIMEDTSMMRRLNSQLMQVTRALRYDEGLASDVWVRNPLVISDPMNGYAELTLPGLQIAIRNNDGVALRSEVAKLVLALDRATARLGDCVATLRAG